MKAVDDQLVSIIVPSFNQGTFLRETLESIFGQGYRPLEILVLDGGSTDETVAILESYGDIPELRWWSEPDKGVVEAVNKGFERAQGSVIGIQSSDDLYLPNAISQAVDTFSHFPDLGLVYGDVEYIDSESRHCGREVLEPFSLAHYLGRLSYIPQPATFFRASLLSSIGGWRDKVSYAADADFWMRIAVRYQARHLEFVMGQYRYHKSQRDKEKTLICRDWENCVKDLQESGLLDRKLWRWANMGIHLARYRYCPESHWSLRTIHLYRAVFSNPYAIMHPNFPKRELLPGREPIWRYLSRIKRLLGFPPRQ